MSLEAKKNELVKLFLCFPSERQRGEQQAMMTAAAYLETLSNFSLEVLSAACSAIRKRPIPFPPSAGEVFTECKAIEAMREKQAEWQSTGARRIAFTRPPLPSKRYTRDQLADWSLIINGSGPYVMREDKDGAPLRIPHGFPGEGQLVEYGYLTPAEADAASAERSNRPRMQEAAE